MRRILALSFFGAFLLAQAAGAAVPPESRTLFHHAESAWAVGTIRLSKPLPFREGKILAFPSEITDLLWAPDGTKPRSLMLVYEVPSSEKGKPSFQQGDEIFAPIQLLPQHSYWKDNLPNTRRHAIAGGKRYAFRGEEAVEVAKLLAPYLAATEMKGMERWHRTLESVANALGSTIPVVREDAVRYFAVFPTLGRDFDDKSLPPITGYLSGDAPAEQKAMLVDALASAKVTAITPTLTELAKRDDATGAVALRGLDRLGQGAPTDRLLVLSRSSSVEMQAYAAETLGSRSATDAAALERVTEILAASGTNPAVVAAVAKGLGQAGGDKVVAVLAAAVARGDSTSRPAAEALAGIGGPTAESALASILREKQGEAAMAAAAGLGRMASCAQCAVVLHEQHEAHADPAVRQFIGVLLGVPLVHKH